MKEKLRREWNKNLKRERGRKKKMDLLPFTYKHWRIWKHIFELQFSVACFLEVPRFTFTFIQLYKCIVMLQNSKSCRTISYLKISGLLFPSSSFFFFTRKSAPTETLNHEACVHCSSWNYSKPPRILLITPILHGHILLASSQHIYAVTFQMFTAFHAILSDLFANCFMYVVLNFWNILRELGRDLPFHFSLVGHITE